MSKFLHRISIILLSLMTSMMYAQQLPDPGFEDWSGAQFSGNIQPKYWNFSNVSQMGVDRNFAHQTNGRSGKALKIQDQFVGVMGIGATSPGYVALGHPWAYVSSITSIEDATAGTYGGINWTYRPDTMVVWIKRYYDSGADNAAGDHTGDENFNLIYYAWSGTSYGKSYKAKNLSCTQLDNVNGATQYCVDEESDIRQALDGNECETKVYAKQIAEGWYYEKKAYANWTRIAVPIYYMNDDVPEKCNVILSAGNYPNFRANSGQNAGTSMDVDDIQLIYSSKAQKLYVGGREWKAFDPNNTGEQVYSLGLGATTIPEIYAVRGAGTLTNNKKEKASFPGRRLGDGDCTITYGQVDGEPTLITIKAGDNSSTTTYRIKFVSQTSNNARLADIKVNGETVSGFNAYLTSYDVALPYGTTEVPVVSATAQDGTATVQITQPTSVNGISTIVVTAGDGTTTQTYTLHFSVAALTDVTLRNIFVDGTPLAGFQPSKSNYNVSLPLGTTTAPAITWESAYAAGAQNIKLLNNTLEAGAQIQVTIPGTSYSKTYKLTYKIEASSYSYLAGIALNGTPLEGFTPEQTVYTIVLPLGTTVLPTITWTAGDPYQTVQLTEGGVEGTSTLKVTAASGATTTYRLQFRTEKSNNNALASIMLDGEALESFDPDTLLYRVVLPAGTNTLPTVSYVPGDAYQTVAVSVNQSLQTVRLTVTAGDGSTRQYMLTFEVQKSENAFLQMIYLNGAALEGFEATTLDYNIVWPTAVMPTITVLPDEGQTVTVSAPSTYGTARIVVTPEEGSANTYLLHFVSPNQVVMPAFPMDSFPASNNALLKALYIDGQKYESFRADQYEYTYPLAWRTTQVPAVVPVAGATGQTITVAHGQVEKTTTIRVVAADGVTAQTYRIAFPAAKSNNTALLSVEIEGTTFAFDPAQHDYTNIPLPYGTLVSPSISVERAEPEQSLKITEAPLGKTSSVVVTAEDGTQATYTFTYQVDYPAKTNELLAIVVDGYGALDMTQAPNFTIDLPFGTTTMNVVSVTKNYPEQEVFVLGGGVTTPTTITVHSMNPNEADMVYTLTPNVYPYDPAMFLDLKVNGSTLPEFRPDVFNYVVAVDDAAPSVTYTKTDNAILEEAVTNAKFARFEVSAGDYIHTYTVTFFYRNDVTFDLGFENWSTFTQHPEGRNGEYPVGWNATINAPTTYPSGVFGSTKGYYWPEENVKSSTKHTVGSKSAQIQTVYITKSSESMPGILSLSPLSITLGYYNKLSSSSQTIITFGAPVKFRNTPDQIQLDYNLEANNKVTGWQFLYTANDEAMISGVNNFSGIQKNKWYTFSRDLSYDPDFVPKNLDIKIVSAETLTPNDYRLDASGISSSNHYTSSMYVDNLRLNYSKAFSAVQVNGVNATIDGANIAATIGADDGGIPRLVLTHAVSDQMPVVTWSEEIAGVRTATIRNYAEDLSYTDYTLTVTRPQSSNTACAYTLNGRDLTVTKGSPYQTVAISENDTAFVITVTAENGEQAVYYAAWDNSSASSPRVSLVPGEKAISGTSTAHLLNIVAEPVLNYEREYALDSVFMVETDSTYVLHVFGTSVDTTYIIARTLSDNALLASMETNEVSVPDFYSETFDYTVSLPSLDSFEATTQDPDAEARHTVVQIDEENYAIFVLVTAADGKTQKRYSVLANVRTLSSDAYLTAITSNDVLLADFSSDKYQYTLQLPAHSLIPTISSVACAGATVEAMTQTVGSSAMVIFQVTSEDGTADHTYSVIVEVLPSEVCTLSDLIVGNTTIDGFAPTQTSYSVELPSGTTVLPEVEYILEDKNSTAVKAEDDHTVTVTVTAEDGTHQTVYTILFTIAKSTNANLASIELNGEALLTFFVDEYHYDITLPFGAELPVITATAEDTGASVQINGTTITVVAEDGVTSKIYTIDFAYLPSTNSNLASIELNGVMQKDYQPDVFEYADTVLYGATMPVITWTLADEQQVVDTTWIGDTELTIAVTAGDGVTTSEYTLTFFHKLSSNCFLVDLQIRGTTVDGFRPDSVEYTVSYPVGSTESDFFDLTDVIAVPDDPDATVTYTMEGETVQILVTAPDGTRAVYVIDQIILLSSEARLKMAWLNDVEVRDFNPDSLSYTILISQGASLPLIDAETLDTLATWEQSMPVELENGYLVEIYSTAQDGWSLTYTLNFQYANWNASTTIDTDDYVFVPIGGGQYKAVTIGVGVQIGIYDLSGRLQMIGTVPTADPSDVVVSVDTDGNQRIVSVLPTADGLVYTAPAGQTMFYVFFDSKTKKVAKGGKFGWLW